jgi:hypothetical protein
MTRRALLGGLQTESQGCGDGFCGGLRQAQVASAIHARSSTPPGRLFRLRQPHQLRPTAPPRACLRRSTTPDCLTDCYTAQTAVSQVALNARTATASRSSVLRWDLQYDSPQLTTDVTPKGLCLGVSGALQRACCCCLALPLRESLGAVWYTLWHCGTLWYTLHVWPALALFPSNALRISAILALAGTRDAGPPAQGRDRRRAGVCGCAQQRMRVRCHGLPPHDQSAKQESSARARVRCKLPTSQACRVSIAERRRLPMPVKSGAGRATPAALPPPVCCSRAAGLGASPMTCKQHTAHQHEQHAWMPHVTSHFL